MTTTLAETHETSSSGAEARVAGRPSPDEVRVLACCAGLVVFGGLERMFFEALRVVIESGGRVHCVVNDWGHSQVSAAAERIGAEWTTTWYRHRVRRRMISPFKWIKLFIGILRTSGELLVKAYRFSPTHVFLPEHFSALVNLPALLVLRLAGIRIVLRVGVGPETTPFYHRLWRRLVGPVVDEIICNSRFTRDEVVSRGVDPAKVSFVYNPDLAAATKEPTTVEKDPKSIIFVGQMIPPKGVHLLLEAVRELVRRGHEPRLDLVGTMDGWEHPAYAGYRQSLRDLASSPKLLGRVQFLGWRDNVTELMARCTVHCCPSLPEQREGFGSVNVEAKAAGVPTVVFPTGALPELVSHRIDGWICTECSAEALADGLEFFLSDPERAAQAGVAARASLSRFSREAFAAKWRSVFWTGGPSATHGTTPREGRRLVPEEGPASK